MRGNSILVSEDEDIMILAEETVHVLEGAVRSLWVEEVDDGEEGSVEDDPDDVEFPAEGLDTDGGNFDDCKTD